MSPAPVFGGRAQNATSVMSGAAESQQPAKAFKIGDAIGVKGARPTNTERVHNMGMFGMGGGNFDKSGNVKNSPMMFDQSPNIDKKKHKSLLGDFTLYRVNKEFENF